MSDSANTGWVDHEELGEWIAKAYAEYHWFAGVMYWQYISDLSGNCIRTSMGYLKEQCSINKDCR